MRNVMVLNADLQFLCNVSWQRAINLIFQKKAEVLEESERIICNADKSCQLFVPKIIRLIQFVDCVFKNHVPFTYKNVLIRDNYTCKYCGLKNDKMTIDHIIPVSKGGKNEFENCVTSCRQCNNKKGNKFLEEIDMKIHGQPPHRPKLIEFLIKKSKQNGTYQTLKEIGTI